MSESINNSKGGLYQGQLRSRARATPPTTTAAATAIMKKSHLSVPHTSSTIIDNNNPAGGGLPPTPIDHDDRFNYALLLALYTLQCFPS
mmetsp:Transcript_8978/g.17887  ORF Transcript_8978/g.17887 Transcript_8978/m.17887 type:complete len:89 (-) Transcript_8978:46-312(-)